MCLGTSYNVPPCLPPEPWTPPLACKYAYNPVIHTAGGIIGVIIASAFALAVLFIFMIRGCKSCRPRIPRLCRNFHLRSRVSELFSIAGYNVPNYEPSSSYGEPVVIEPGPVDPNDSIPLSNIQFRSARTSTGITDAPAFQFNLSLFSSPTDSEI